MKKLMKRIGAVLMAVAMMAALGVSAWAAAETTIEATNLTAGDSVEYYQLISYDPTSTTGWILTDLGSACGVTLDNLLNGISQVEASTIATSLASAQKTGDMDVNGTTATATVDAGLYYLKAIPAATNVSTVYNPAFVSADYKAGGNTVDLSTSYENSAVLKKSDVPFDKEVTGSDTYVDVKPGDVIPYKVTATIPSYGTSFTSPVFKVEDTLSEGLDLTGDVTVKYKSRDDVTTVVSVTQTNTDVTITKKDENRGYIVEFSAAYLKALNGAMPDVEITYNATVTTGATTNVTYMDNTAKLTFSNSPTTTTDKEDITRHYTFTIDGDLLGGTSGVDKTSELIKTGVDAEGNPITEESERVTYHETPVSPLAGATFTLVGLDNNSSINLTAQSDRDGRINFKGLDAGQYRLTETRAPDGFVKCNDTFLVTITPTYTGDVLQSYTITFKNERTNDEGRASFTMTNTGEGTATETTASTIESATQFIANTQGTELPSTGGIGTYIFTVTGVAIMAIAAGLLIVRHKKKAE